MKYLCLIGFFISMNVLFNACSHVRQHSSTTSILWQYGEDLSQVETPLHFRRSPQEAFELIPVGASVSEIRCDQRNYYFEVIASNPAREEQVIVISGRSNFYQKLREQRRSRTKQLQQILRE